MVNYAYQVSNELKKRGFSIKRNLHEGIKKDVYKSITFSSETNVITLAVSVKMD